ncbi:MAG: hypothetical protein ABSG46_07215, partial [Candidatus Binataceae bacterium]
MSATAAITSIPRAGVDLTEASYYSAQSQANYFQNPGFEWPQFAQAIGVASVPSTSSFTALNKIGAGAEPANFWTGANLCTVRVGTCSDNTNNYCWNNTATTVAGGGCTSGGTCNAGTLFSIAAYNSTGGTQTFSCSGNCPALVA